MNSIHRNELDLTSLADIWSPPALPLARLTIEHALVYLGDASGTVLLDATIVAEHGVITSIMSGPSVVDASKAPASSNSGAANQPRSGQTPRGHIAQSEVRIDASGAIVLPAFVDSHYHEIGPYRFLEHGRSPDDPSPYGGRGFDGGGDLVRLTRDLGDRPTLAASLSEEHLALGTLFGMWQQLRRGIVTFGEVGSVVPGNIVADVAAQVGLRSRVGLWASDITIGSDGSLTRIRDADQLLAQLDDVASRISVHGPTTAGLYPSCMFVSGSSDELLVGLAAVARAHGAPWATHLDCLPNECAVSKAVFGYSPIERAERLGFLGDGLVGVHTSYFDDDDRHRLVRHAVRLSHAPAKYMTSGENVGVNGRLLDARRAGVEVSLSTDSEVFAIGGMIEAMRATMALHNQASNSATAVAGTDALAMGTSLGANALGWSEITGSIAVGKQCDVVIVRTDDWRFAASSRPLDTLMHLGSSADIDTVISAGRVLVAGGQARYIDEAALIERFHRSSRTVAQSVGMAPAHWSATRFCP